MSSVWAAGRLAQTRMAGWWGGEAESLQLINFKTLQMSSLHWLEQCEKLPCGISVLSRMQCCHPRLFCMTIHSALIMHKDANRHRVRCISMGKLSLEKKNQLKQNKRRQFGRGVREACYECNKTQRQLFMWAFFHGKKSQFLLLAL